MKKPAAPSAAVDAVTLKPERKGGLPAIPANVGRTTNVLESVGIPRIFCATPAKTSLIVPSEMLLLLRTCYYIYPALFLYISCCFSHICFSEKTTEYTTKLK